MNGYIFDIKKFALHDGPGIRTTIFLKGCPLKCWWCHNPESIKAFTENGINTCEDFIQSKIRKHTVDEVLKIVNDDYIFYDESGGGVTFSGGEPLVQVEFLEKILNECKKNQLHTTVDTSGYSPTSSFKQIYMDTDLFLFDLKFIDNDQHKKYTGVPNQLIKENLKFLSANNANVLIRVPLIPNITDTPKNLGQIADFLLSQKLNYEIELLPYNKLAEDKYRRLNEKSKLGDLETQSNDKLSEIKSLVESFGLTTKLIR